ncbi:MAG: hypothetical protein U1E29_17645 [Coriobacteriia bacterium]|nr:hypothetical protein [Coriobacteriia bacterium]
MFIYEEALARYAGPHVTPELEAAMLRIQEEHHDQIVREVMSKLHDTLMDGREEKAAAV